MTLTKMDVNSDSKLILVLNLELNELNESLLFRCHKYNKICFTTGSSLFGRQIVLMTNYSNDSKRFDRNKYEELPFGQQFGQQMASICFESSGSFHFYFTERESDSICGAFYVVVSPELTVGHKSHSKQVDLNAIQCQTVLTKCLSRFQTWKSKLEVF